MIKHNLTPLCPYCKVDLGELYKAVAEEHRKKRVATLCMYCGEPLMIDKGKGIFRKPTDDEFVDLVSSPQHASARGAWLKLKQRAEQRRYPPLYEQFLEYKQDDAISGASEENAKYARDGFYAGAAAMLHLILQVESEDELRVTLDMSKAEIRGYFDKD